MNRFLLTATVFLALIPLSANSNIPDGEEKVKEKIETPEEKSAEKKAKKPGKKKKKSFLQTLASPIKWIGKNWSAYDLEYSTPSFYNWAAQLQNTTSCEWIDLGYDDVDISMRSKVSQKLGPYISYGFLGYGFSVDINAINGSKRKNEFTLAINSNLMNVDIIRRRTGGDFMIDYLDILSLDKKEMDFSDLADHYNVGENVKYNITGININVFTNHKKYSNPAAFSNGAIQLRSVGSPIIGIGYTHQKLQNSIANKFLDHAAQKVGYERFTGEMEQLGKMIFDNNTLLNFTTSTVLNTIIPSYVSVKDLHLQLGWAQNIAFSKRLLLGMSFVASPGVKFISADNFNSYQYEYSKDIASIFDAFLPFFKEAIETGNITINSEKTKVYILGLEKVDSEIYQIDENRTSFGSNFSARATLTYNYNRWRFGFNAIGNAFLFNRDIFRFNNYYGSVNVYAGYCFGRKKQYREGGRDREMYIKAALTKAQIEEMRDTMPESNINGGNVQIRETKYHTDHVRLNVRGCDLVTGPEGSYGSFEIKDGHISNADDSQGLLRKGTKFEIDEDGSFYIRASHNARYRTANWWKKRLALRQNSMNRYPELLHYALCGKLTLYVRSYHFGTTEPVRVVIDNFYLCHGKVTDSFFEIGADKFSSQSTASITGRINVNGRQTRVYIENKKNGKSIDLYINPLRASTERWMAKISDSTHIAKISIPGTHDAGSASLKESPIVSTGHTQNFSIREQLADGIRAFDLRLKKDMKFGHTLKCRDGLPETLKDMNEFLNRNPSEFLVAMIGSDEAGAAWQKVMKDSLLAVLAPYRHLLIDDFCGSMTLKDVRGKILLIKRQKDCPFGKHLPFENNTVFTANGFHVEDVYKEHKTFRKIKIVEQHLREAYENKDPNLWYITFNTIAWDPRHHKPYYTAWGATNIRKPMNPSLQNIIDMKAYGRFGIVFLDFYNDHGDQTQLVNTIIKSNFNIPQSDDFIPAEF